MNPLVPVILALVLAPAISLRAQDKPADPAKVARLEIAEINKKAGLLLGEKKTGEARAEYARIAALPGAEPADKVTAMLAIADTYLREKDYAKAEALYAEISASTEATPQSRVAAAHGLFASLQNQKKNEEARAVYLKALEMPDLPAKGEKARFLFNIGKSYEEEKNLEKSSEIYARILAGADFPNYYKIQALRSLAKARLDQQQFDEARAEYAKALTLPALQPLEKADLLISMAASFEIQREFEKARKEYLKALEVEGLDAKGKAKVLAATARLSKTEGDLAGMKQGLADLAGVSQAPDYPLLRDYAILAGLQGNAQEEALAWDQILALPELPAARYGEAAFKKLDLLALSGNRGEAKKLASEVAANYALTEEQRFLATLLAVGFSMESGKALSLKSPVPASLDPEKQLAAYYEAGRVFMKMRNYDAARSFAEKADSLFQKNPDPVYECKFMDKAPFGVLGWANSDLVKDASRREARFEKYNQKAADLLINDVNVTRSIGEAGAKSESNIGFFMAADLRGWHIYVQCRDDQVESVVAGLVGGDALEVYFAPGKGEYYHQICLKVPDGKPEFVPWMSPHRNYRKLDGYFVSEVAPAGEGFGIYMMIPWEAVYDKLPREGTLWPFGIVDFGRGGGFTWGGGQVHELNAFGKVRFSGVARFLPAIHRAIVMKAFANYKKSSAAARRFWNDEVKGDRAFFETVLRPELNKLDEAGKLVAPEMSQQDVERLFVRAVPDWMELEYLISERRAQYLEAGHFIP
jgi:tetratricopeptide (TPR) repeat protein